MNFIQKYLIFSLLLTFPAINAQLPHGGKPYPFTSFKSVVTPLYLDGFNLQHSVNESLSNDAVSGKKPFTFAWNHTLELNPENSGVWTETSDGTRIWRLHLVSRGAYGVNVDFNSYQLKPGCMLFIYPPAQDLFLGGFNYQNNNSSKSLPTAFINGDELVIELQTMPGISDYGLLQVGSMAHAFIDLFSRKDGRFGLSGDCNIDINCPEGKDWKLIKKAVCRIVFKQGGTTEFCTGTLINNVRQDTIPYLLTANHCIWLASHASSAVFYFDYESDSCKGTDDTTFFTLAGSSLLATSDSIDFSLLSLSESPPEIYKPYYAGWSLSANPPTSAVCIHHPQGDVKKISIDNDALTGEYQDPIPSNLSWLTRVSVPAAFWRVIDWDLGTTEGGSSGSPLFNQEKLVVGNLTGGEANCTNSVNDYYSKFSVAWDHYQLPSMQLRHWLDPDSAGISFLKGFDPFGIPDSTPTDTFATRFTLFPNPATGLVTFETDSLDISGGTIAIYSLTGKKMVMYSITESKSLRFDISFLEQGIYILEFNKGNINEKKRLFVLNPLK